MNSGCTVFSQLVEFSPRNSSRSARTDMVAVAIAALMGYTFDRLSARLPMLDQTSWNRHELLKGCALPEGAQRPIILG
jgi:hypothetical protein